MRLKALFFVVCSAVVVVSATLPAAAQTVVVLGKGIQRRADRPDGLDSRLINWDDCQAGSEGDTFGVTFTVTGASPPALEIWAGVSSSCADATFRTATANVPGLCWQIGLLLLPVSSSVALSVRDILPHGASGAGTGLADTCAMVASTPTGSGVVTLFFIPTDGIVNAGTGASLAVTYDLKGPAAPETVSVTPGDTQLELSWSLLTNAALDTKGYQLYCEPAGSSDPESCIGFTLQPGESVLGASPRSTAGPSATHGIVEGLNNGERYACGIAAFDAVSNSGPLSSLVCMAPLKGASTEREPEPSGPCQLGHAPATPATSLATLALLAALARRRASRRAPRGAPDPK
jgi:hypothetical protein